MRFLVALIILVDIPSAFADTERHVVVETQAARFAAMIDADGAALGDIMSEDLVYTHTTGRSESKQEFIASVTSGDISYDAIKPDDVLVRLYDDVAIVTGTAAMVVSSRQANFEFTIRFIEVYRLVDGSWELVSWQSTRLAEQ